MGDADTPKSPERPEPAGISRREIFHVIGSVPAVATAAAGLAGAQTHDAKAHPAHSERKKAAGPYQRRVFDDRQWRTVGILCDLIIPADERSGSATQAGVPEFIDDWLDFRTNEDGNDNFAAQILGGLAWLDLESKRLSGNDFAGATAAQQKQILDRIAWPDRAAAEDHHAVLFFNKFRDLTVSGFFSSKIGIADLPYLGNRAVAEWKGCEPTVWARIEERLRTGYRGLGGEAKPLLA